MYTVAGRGKSRVIPHDNCTEVTSQTRRDCYSIDTIPHVRYSIYGYSSITPSLLERLSLYVRIFIIFKAFTGCMGDQNNGHSFFRAAGSVHLKPT